ncbi:MAG: hypothetical protein ACR2QV_10090 [Gammaproteobacteria bacterium]
MVRQVLLSIAAVTVIMTAAPLQAQESRAEGDRLIISNVKQAEANAGVRPNRGMSMDSVEARWGTPRSKRGAVGDPPITRWEYPTFVVYFEYRNVIHAVRTAP